MSSVRDLHARAMALVHQADMTRLKGEEERTKELVKEACRYEGQAADQISLSQENEPTRSILYDSAASLAFQNGDWKLAERLVFNGLSGFPPLRIKAHLKELYEEINLQSHLELKGVVLEDADFQISLYGEETGIGFVPYHLFDRRIKNTDALLKRTFLRICGQKWIEDLRKKTLFQPLRTAISIPRAASFAVTIRLTRQAGEQFPLPLTEAKSVINEVLTCLELINEEKEGELRERINDDSYYRHFLVHAKEIAPDGEKIKLVGFTSRDHQIKFRRKQTSVGLPQAFKLEKQLPTDVEGMVGILDYASSKKGKVGLTTEDKKEYSIIIKQGMEDLVRSYFGKYVSVSGALEGKEISPTDIQSNDEE